MSTGKQHVNIYQKLLLRRQLMGEGAEGAAYVPFIGDGDIASELYRDLEIYGADIDPKRVATSRARLPDAEILVADCDRWPFDGIRTTFSLADLDPYTNPYPSLVAFWDNAQEAFPFVLFGTDGLRQAIIRRKAVVTLPSGKGIPAGVNEARKQYNFWWLRNVLPFVEETVAPARVKQKRFYLRGPQLYWGVVVDE